jgi:HK97 family phage major capsid protein
VTSALAAEIVREALANPSRRQSPARSSYAEYRTAARSGSVAFDPEAAFWKYLTSRVQPEFAGLLHADDTLSAYALEPTEQRVLSKATSAAGGYLVPSDFDDLITSARRARNVIGELARNLETANGRALPLPTVTAHGVGSWIAENAAFPAGGSDDTFGQVPLSAFKCGTGTRVSEELLADAAMDSFDSYLGDELGQRLALLEENAFAVGDGSGKPLGIANASSGITTVVAATGSATGFKLADVRAAWAGLPDAYKLGAAWVMSPSALASLANLTDTANALILPSLHASEPTLYGAPVFSSPELPAAAANARSVVLGNFKLGYAVRRVRGYGMQRQQELYSDSGQVGFRLYERLDGRVILADALRVLVNSAT